MLDWVRENEPILGLAFQAITAFVWLVYLQILVMGFVRQRRPNILIHRSIGLGDESRCFVSNMGAEAVYLIGLLAEMTIDGTPFRAFVTDRDGTPGDEDDSAARGTAQGPIAPGAMVDAGTFGDIVQRGLRRVGRETDGTGMSDLRLTALCASGESDRLVGATRDFRVGSRDGSRGFVPVRATSTQIGSWLQRRRLRRLLEEDLRQEAELYVRRRRIAPSGTSFCVPWFDFVRKEWRG